MPLETDIPTAVLDIVDAEIVEPEAPGKELARANRTIVVAEAQPQWREWRALPSVTVTLPPPLSPAETVTAYLPLPEKFNWHKWVFDVGDAVHDGDMDAVQTLLDLGLRKGFA